MDLRGGWNQPPTGWGLLSCFSRLKGDIIRFGIRFGKCVYTTRMYWRLCVFSLFSIRERAISSTPSSSKHQMDPLYVKDEPNVCEWRVLLALGHIRPTIVAKLLTVCARIWLVAGQDLVPWSWHDWLALNKIKDGPCEDFIWVTAWMQSREKVHGGGDCGDLQDLDFMNWCLHHLGDVRSVLWRRLN